MKHRIFALILVLVLALSLLPGRVLAAGFQMLPEPVLAPMPQAVLSQPQAKTYSVTMTSTGSGRAELYNNAAEAGESVYFLADPAPGYKVSFEKCGYYPEPGEQEVEIYLKYIGANVYELKMPAGNVVLNLEFVQITSANHNVRLAVSTGGMATVDQQTAKKGESLFVEVITSPGYLAPTVKATCGGKEVKTYYLSTMNGVRLYELLMPDGDLEIRVTFRKLYHSVNVTVENKLGGTAVADVTEAKEGRIVTLTCTPNEGYRLAQITGVEGLTDNGGGIYTFPMPDRDVNVKVLFLRHENPFCDVNETQFFYEPVLWALKNGITSGVSATAFGPFQDCNRAQVVTFLWRCAGSPAPKHREIPSRMWRRESGTPMRFSGLWKRASPPV